MSVLLLILKIIGIVLLVVLALLVLIIIALLFVPFAYRVKGSYHGKPDLTASIYGLCYLAGGGIMVSDSGKKIYLRIFGIRKFLSSGNKPDKSGNTDQYDETMQDCEKTDDSNEQNPEKKALNESKNVMDIQSERTKRAFTKLKASLWKLLHILMPRRLKLDLEFSTGSPDTTAQLLGILAMFPVGYQNRWNVHPDFTADNAYADAKFDVKGRILGFSLLKLILGLVLDKDCQKLYNYFRNMKA